MKSLRVTILERLAMKKSFEGAMELEPRVPITNVARGVFSKSAQKGNTFVSGEGIHIW